MEVPILCCINFLQYSTGLYERATYEAQPTVWRFREGTKGRPGNYLTAATWCVSAHTGADMGSAASRAILSALQPALRKVKTKHVLMSHCLLGI